MMEIEQIKIHIQYYLPVAMVLVVGSLLAFTASSLKPNITENKRIEKQQNILYAMGVNENEGRVHNFVFYR